MHAFEKHPHWEHVKLVVGRLTGHGHQALLAGGCVRDLLMNRVPNDFDIASDATPEQVEALFERALTVGREFGVTILPFADGCKIEVATFRQDGPYLDGRRPESVTFSSSEEDAKRRDFTVNALFYDLNHKRVIDYVGGQEDLQARVIRAVGEPERRFTEDKLRLLRALRFAGQLEFAIAPETYAAIAKLAPQIRVVAQERIREELLKLLKSPGRVRAVEMARETGLLTAVVPEIDAGLRDPAVFSALLRRLSGAATRPEVWVLRFIYDALTVCHGTEKRQVLAREIFRRLRFSTQESEAMLWTLASEDLFLHPERHRVSALARALAQPAAEVAEAFFAPWAAPTASEAWRNIQTTILHAGRELPGRLITGEDLLSLGFKKGRQLGAVLEEAFNLQLEGQIKTREQALAWAQAQLKT